MRLCTETITVFNKRYDADAGYDVWEPTVIRGVSWFCEIASAVDNTGLHAANRFTIRIPADADTSGKTYVTPVDYGAANARDVFTLANGDVVVKAALDGTYTPAQLHAMYTDFCTVLGVTDNRRAPNAPHFKVVGS